MIAWVESMLIAREGPFTMAGYLFVMNQDREARTTHNDKLLALYRDIDAFLRAHNPDGTYLFDDFGLAEAVFTPFLDRPLDELDPIERTLLRMGTFGLARRIDVPYKVVINEAVALARKFGATDSYKYINGVLDKAAHELRKVETDAAS